MARDHPRTKRLSLAKGPIGIIGLVLLAYGVTGLIFGGNSFTTHPLDGTVTGEKWLELEGNGWTNVLVGGAGGLVVLGAPMHWGAKTTAVLAGLALGAAAIIALVDFREDILGIFAVDDGMIIGLGAAAVALLALAQLPRIERDPGDREGERVVVEREPRVRDAAPAAPEPRRDDPAGRGHEGRIE